MKQVKDDLKNFSMGLTPSVQVVERANIAEMDYLVRAMRPDKLLSNMDTFMHMMWIKNRDRWASAILKSGCVECVDGNEAEQFDKACTLIPEFLEDNFFISINKDMQEARMRLRLTSSVQALPKSIHKTMQDVEKRNDPAKPVEESTNKGNSFAELICKNLQDLIAQDVEKRNDPRALGESPLAALEKSLPQALNNKKYNNYKCNGRH